MLTGLLVLLGLGFGVAVVVSRAGRAALAPVVVRTAGKRRRRRVGR